MASLVNYYPELPIVAYKKVAVPMQQIIDCIKKATAPAEVKRTVYILARNESANASKIVNNNAFGIQADSGRWGGNWDHVLNGVVAVKENGTGKMRYFCAFINLQSCVDFMCERIAKRGIYVGGYAYKVSKRTVKDATDLADVYKEEWVSGNSLANPTQQELKNFVSMYNQAAKLFV